MRYTYLLAIALCLFLSLKFTVAQVNNPLVTNSGEIIDKGVQLHEEENYDAAINEFLKVPFNDTSYFHAQAELCYSYYANEMYDSALAVGRRGLKYASPHRAMFYHSIGNALDDMGKSEEALQVYSEGGKEFPLDHLMLFNMGLTQMRLDQNDAAVESFKKAMAINPYHATSHLYLGLINLDAERLVPGVFGVTTFLLLQPTHSSAFDIVTFLENVLQGEFHPHDTSLIQLLPLLSGEDDFAEQELILNNKIALGKKYKSQSNLDFDIVKQLQVLFETLDPSETAGYFSTNYVPIYRNIYNKGYFETFSYHILSGIGIKEVDAWMSKNKSREEAFINSVIFDIRKIYEAIPLAVNGQQWNLQRWMENGKLAALGNYDDVKHLSTGQWFYFYDNGLLLKEGKYGSDGLETGEWKFYHYRGFPEEVTTFNAGNRNGTSVFLNSAGQTDGEIDYRDGEVEGKIKIHFYSGVPHRELSISNGLRNGTFTEYFRNGKIAEQYSNKEGMINGPYKSYYSNGAVRIECNYKDDQFDGKYVHYYRTGKVYEELNYVDGNPSGTDKIYFENGGLLSEGEFSADGKRINIWKDYYETGVLSGETKYNAAGDEEWNKGYDEDGKLWYQYSSKGGKLNEVIYYDKSGNEISRSTRVKGPSNISGFYPTGELKFKGQFQNDLKVGKWEFYYKNGSLSSIENWDKEGVQTGKYQEFFRNGTLEYEYNYKDGLVDGGFTSFYQNGKIASQGWYVNDEYAGTWVGYNKLGNITSKLYYVDGELHGTQFYYNDLGKLEQTQQLEFGELIAIMNYDTSGNLISTADLKTTTGTISTTWFNGAKNAGLHFENGWIQGNTQYLHANGKVRTEGVFMDDEKEGEWKVYDNHGELERIGIYRNGEAEGKHIFYKNGMLTTHVIFEGGTNDSTITWFYENGKVDQLSHYKDDERHGETIYYNPEGLVYAVASFDHGDIVSYTYKDASGKMAEPIALKNATGAITAYFPNGTKSYEGAYQSGLHTGTFRRYFPGGNVREEDYYENGNHEGIHKEYNAAGQVIVEQTYFANDLNGITTYYYDNGKVSRIENYLLDSPHGEWKYFDKTGKLVKTEIYYCGEMVN